MFDWDKRGLFSKNIGKTGVETKAFRENVKTAIQKLDTLRAHKADYASFIGVLDLPLAGQARIVAKSIPFQVKTMVVLGIGGSYAGAAAAIHALRPRGLKPPPIDVQFLPTVDPESVVPLLNKLDLGSTLVNCVSKSGRTVEVVALYAVFRKRFQDALKTAWKDHFVFTTDPKNGYFRKIARESGVKTMDIPPGLGGRFSVLSPVGLFPMLLAGIDIAAVVNGAREYMQQERPQAVQSAALHKSLIDKGKSIRTLLIYNDSMEDMGKWFAQLWAESLGKKSGDTGIGQTPLLFQGSKDQHSLLQLFMDGPDDKVYTVLQSGTARTDMQIPDGLLDDPDVSDLNGKMLSEVFQVEAQATAAALMRTGKPVEIIRFPGIDARSIGEFFAHFELETAITGLLLGINPFDQPGVEKGKVYAHALLGRQDLLDTAKDLQTMGNMMDIGEEL